MPGESYGQLIALCAGMLLLTAVLMVWRRSAHASVRLLALQGLALTALVMVTGVPGSWPEFLVVLTLVLTVKAVILPLVLARTTRHHADDHESPRLNPIASLALAALVCGIALTIGWPLFDGSPDAAVRAAPYGIAMVLLGFVLLITRRHARAQLVGFLVIDNGIVAVAFLVSGGVPLLLELGSSLDVLLVVLILQAFARRLHLLFGSAEVDTLRELHD